MRRLMVIPLLIVLLVSGQASSASAADISMFAFQRTWARTDQPVAAKQANRTWVWGPAPSSPLLVEPYVEGNANGTAGERLVQYFDKARMEITNTGADPSSQWYVTNGLLAKELITGQMQLGDNQVVQEIPSDANIAGDPDDLNAPTYATFKPLMGYQPIPLGWRITQTVNRLGQIGNDASLAGMNVTAAVHVGATNHNVASVFWDFMNSSGNVIDGWDSKQGPLFQSPFFATGYPITEAYWTTVRVGGVSKLVLVQAFERRVLTYTPDNPDGWKVETGNVGQHYYAWRYLYQGGNPLLIRSLSYHQDAAGNWVFIGDVLNQARAAYASVQVTVNLYDSAGKPVASRAQYLDLSVVPAHEQAPFRVWFDQGTPFARAEVEVSGQPSARFDAPNAAVVAPTASLNQSHSMVSGVLRNDSGAPQAYVSYVVTLYDNFGWLIGYDWGLARPTTLQPGDVATFRADFTDLPSPPASYRVFVSTP